MNHPFLRLNIAEQKYITTIEETALPDHADRKVEPPPPPPPKTSMVSLLQNACDDLGVFEKQFPPKRSRARVVSDITHAEVHDFLLKQAANFKEMDHSLRTPELQAQLKTAMRQLDPPGLQDDGTLPPRSNFLALRLSPPGETVPSPLMPPQPAARSPPPAAHFQKARQPPVVPQLTPQQILLQHGGTPLRQEDEDIPLAISQIRLAASTGSLHSGGRSSPSLRASPSAKMLAGPRSPSPSWPGAGGDYPPPPATPNSAASAELAATPPLLRPSPSARTASPLRAGQQHQEADDARTLSQQASGAYLPPGTAAAATTTTPPVTPSTPATAFFSAPIDAPPAPGPQPQPPPTSPRPALGQQTSPTLPHHPQQPHPPASPTSPAGPPRQGRSPHGRPSPAHSPLLVVPPRRPIAGSSFPAGGFATHDAIIHQMLNNATRPQPQPQDGGGEMLRVRALSPAKEPPPTPDPDSPRASAGRPAPGRPVPGSRPASRPRRRAPGWAAAGRPEEARMSPPRTAAR
ncbi:hypothetical protein PAPYR_64 [Paratrimastix pyriformis]|uniref:Uncharacterized protein n=1 Tax=Paratrimastix pyriformis TaxID=342808 RepID=A0ABQ8UWA3_9EUKA|nr:hypothetical protein PAPYR_64 [Paratrimastix pyriformis]